MPLSPAVLACADEPGTVLAAAQPFHERGETERAKPAPAPDPVENFRSSAASRGCKRRLSAVIGARADRASIDRHHLDEPLALRALVGASEDAAAARGQDPVVEVAEQHRQPLFAQAEHPMQRFDQSRDHHRQDQHRDRERERGIKCLHGRELWLPGPAVASRS